MNTILENFVSEHQNTLLDFYTDWCEPCKWVEPILNEVGKHYSGKIKIVKVDLDQFSDLAKTLTILSVPTLILFSNKKEVWRMRGFEPAPQLIKTISKYIQ